MKGLRSKLMIIELDGATWDVMRPLIASNQLPNIASLMKRGVSGNLISEHPLISPRLWVTIFSGKKSAEHGVEFFGSSSSMVKTRRIWDIVSDKGHKVGVFGSFVTWPPYEVNGFMIPSLFSIGPETYPDDYSFLQELTLGERKKNKPGLEAEAKGSSRLGTMAGYAMKLKRHGVSTRTLLESLLFLTGNMVLRPPQDERYWKKATLHLKVCTEFFTHLHGLYKPDFSTFHIHLCDALAHRYWKYYEPDKFKDVDEKLVARYGRVIPQSYIDADRTVGDFIDAADKDTAIMLLSDHGAQAMETLKESFRLKPDFFLRLMGIEKKVIPANIGFMTFLYFSDKGLLKEIAERVEAMSFVDDGEKIFEIIYEESLIGIRLREVFWGTSIPPERAIDVGDLGEAAFSDLFSPHKMDVSGDHKLEGVIIAAGPGIKKDETIPDASIYDITPTALALMGLEVARDMPGKVLKNIFTEELKVSYIDSFEAPEAVSEECGEEGDMEVDKIKGRLKALGYL